MARMSRRLSIVAIAFTLLAVAVPAWAHVDAPIVAAARPVVTELGPEALSAAEPAGSSVWLLVAGAVVLLASMLRRRSVLALALLVLLTCGVFETGLHSVHHLTDADAAKCSVAAVSSHAGGTIVATIAIERPADVAMTSVPAHVAAVPRSSLSAPDLGRAPPSA
jgi:hypothetical protein